MDPRHLTAPTPQAPSAVAPALRLHAAFLGYTVFAVSVIVFLIFYVAPQHGTSSIFVYIGICSLAGSLSVMSCKARGGGAALPRPWPLG